MKKFLDDNFLLSNKTAVKLYHNYAKKMPIFDYHCHLNIKDIYEDRQFSDLTEVWLVEGNYGDHYKWRAMRTCGIDEKYITGDATPFEKFQKWAEIVPLTIGNPLYHWVHLELRRFFSINKLLNKDTAKEIYDEANLKLKTLTARKLILMSNVKIICTTDDPVDDLKYHKLLKEDKSFSVNVLPAFRPDKAVNIELETFRPWLNKLEDVNGKKIENLDDFLKALEERIEYFDMVGCKVSDHALDTLEYEDSTKEEVIEIFKKALNNETLEKEEIAKYKGFMLVFFGNQYSKHNWVMQYHIGALRNNSRRMYEKIGPDTGFDAINDNIFAEKLAKLLNKLDSNDSLPKTILYSLNPRDHEVLCTIGGCFQGGISGKIQLGSGWWFNDQKDGMIRQLTALSNMGILSRFVGMLTDSRSFLSYPRHEYFRRILCNYLGNLIENGEYPNELEFVGKIVEDICYNNAYNYFRIEEKK